jgi:hypothetical protein
MRIKTSELAGSALDWAVAKCEGKDHVVNAPHKYVFEPSTDWARGGPIIEREGIAIGSHLDGEEWIAEDYWREATWSGPTPLVAAMRCYVASKLGDEVEIPASLETAQEAV